MKKYFKSRNNLQMFYLCSCKRGPLFLAATGTITFRISSRYEAAGSEFEQVMRNYRVGYSLTKSLGSMWQNVALCFGSDSKITSVNLFFLDFRVAV